MGGAGFVILFVVFMVGCGIWSMIYFTFAAHYFLATITDSGVGVDEIEFSGDSGIVDWWWKPIFCAWIFTFWLVPVTVIVGPLLAASPLAFVIGLSMVMLAIFPLSVLSALYAQNWFSFLNAELTWRMLRRIGAFTYVQLASFIFIAASVGLLVGVFGHTFLWAAPASFAIPTALLLYARHWGRLSWMALNFLPPGAKKPKKKRPKPTATEAFTPDAAPEMDVQEIDAHAEAISAGVPPMFPSAIQTSIPATAAGIIPAKPVATAALDEEEDEWATDKKPYGVIEDEATPSFQPSIPAYDREPKSDLDKPMSLTQYYDDKARKEKEEQAKRAEANRRMPVPTKKAPTFQEALLRGVWEFMIYSGTLRVWFNLVVLTAVELLFIVLVKQFWPRLD